MAREAELERSRQRYYIGQAMMTLDQQLRAAVDRGDFSTAAQLLTAALKADAGNAHLHYNLGAVLNKLGRFDEALDNFDRAARLKPEFTDAHHAAAKILVQRNALGEAVVHYRKCLALKPDDAEFLKAVSFCLEGAGQIDQAMSFLLEQFSAASSNWLAATVAAFAHKHRRTPQLREYANSVFAVAGTSLDTLNSIGTMLSLAGDDAGGLAAFHHWHAAKALAFRRNISAPSMLVAACTYSAAAPSPRYGELIEQYTILHRDAAREGKGTFEGIRSFIMIAPFLRDYARQMQATDMLDYGGGRGAQYKLQGIEIDGTTHNDTCDYLGIKQSTCFDPGVTGTREFGKYDLVACVDALEHCDRQDLPWIVRQLFQCARKGVFANIASYKANKILPNGENAHCTIEPAEWWMGLFAAVATEFPTVDYRVIVTPNVKLRDCVGFCR